MSMSDFDYASTALQWHKMLESLINDGELSQSRANAWLSTVAAESKAGHLISWVPWFDLFARR